MKKKRSLTEGEKKGMNKPGSNTNEAPNKPPPAPKPKSDNDQKN
jgi:hypothetical protein